jgi:hypothetical protein
MAIEPNAAGRLRLVAATSADPTLRLELLHALQEAPSMPFAPSPELEQAIAACSRCSPEARLSPKRTSLCAEHRSRWNQEMCAAIATADVAETSLETLTRGVLETEEGGVELLSALRKHMDAIRIVLEGYQRGAVQLPAGVADILRDTQRQTPSFLAGGLRTRM